MAEKSSFVKASEELHLAQPSVSSRIQSLENELGYSLFIRNRKSVELSPEGQAFLPYAHKMIKTADDAKKTLVSMSNSV